MILPIANAAGYRFINLIFSPIQKYFLYSTPARLYSLEKMSRTTSQAKWKNEKNRILNMEIEEKRKLYRSDDYLYVDKIETWNIYAVRNQSSIEGKKHTLEDLKEYKKHKYNSELDKSLSEKVSIFKGDITKLEIDAIVNAANSALRAGGGVDGAIHRAAGPLLQSECLSLGGCKVGEAKVTGGYNLPAKYVIHTVGPQDGNPQALKSCYEKCLSHQQEYKLKSISFPCISTGIYGFPNRLAAHIALSTARKFLEANCNNDDFNRIIFCTFMPVDIDIYETLMQMYFPLQELNYNDGPSLTES